MSCDFLKIREADSKDVMQCSRCGLEISIRRGSIIRASRCRVADGGYKRGVPRNKGVGTELKKIFTELGIPPTSACQCDAKAREWNANGVEWCQTHRAEIIAHIHKAYSSTDISTIMRAVAMATVTGLVIRINPLDVPGSLLDEAIRRAENKACAS
jgi:hypothetical protein